MRTIRLTAFLGLSLLLAPAPLFAQNSVAEFEAFAAEFEADVRAHIAADYATEGDYDRAYNRLKRMLKPVLYRAEAEYERSTQFAVGYEGLWNVNGQRTFSRTGSPPQIQDLSGELQIEREAYPATVVTGQLSTPAEGEHLDIGYGDGEVYVIEFKGDEVTPRKISLRLRGWMRHGKATINRDKTLTLKTLEEGPEAVLEILESSSDGALEALGLTPTSSSGGVRFQVEGTILGGSGKKSFEGLAKLGTNSAAAGRSEAGITEEEGHFDLSLQDGWVKLAFTSEEEVDGKPAARGVARLTRALSGMSDKDVAGVLARLNKLNILMRYPRRDPVRYRSNSRKVQARFTPNPEHDPQGVEAWVVELIDDVEKGGTIDIAVFEFQLIRVGEALVRAQQRGVDIRVVHDSDDEHERPARYLARHQVVKTAETAGLQVRMDDGRTSLMHNKFMIINGETVWTGSTNLTPAAMFTQDNNALLFKSAELAAIYQIEFNEMFEQGLFGAMDRDATANTRWSKWQEEPGLRDDWLEIDSLTSVQVYFAPEDHAMDRLLEVIKGAKKSIRFLSFSFASQTLADAMKERMADGVVVEGIFESFGGIAMAPILYQAGAGIRVKAVGNMKLHHKVVVVDGEIVCTGSFNFSDSADMKNDENLVLVRSKPLARKVLQEFRSIWDASRDNDKRVVGEPTPAAAASGTGVTEAIEQAAGND